MSKRWKILLICFGIIICLLVLRMAYIQLAGHGELSQTAEIQQNITLEGADNRGTIYDRNGTPLAGQQQEYIYIIRQSEYDGETQNALNQVDAEEVPNAGNYYRVFTSTIYCKDIGARLIENSDAYIMTAGRRYRDNQPAVHVVGYINEADSSGASGLELMYDEQLGSLNRRLSAAADGCGNFLRGYGLTVDDAGDSNYQEHDVVTTLDTGLQMKAEQLLAGCENNGAALVMNVETGEILASASTPVYDPGCVKEYLDSQNGELINKVTQGEYPPGSVFKIVVAAAALEAGISEDTVYECRGSVTVNGQTVKCQTGGDSGHGLINFKQAFADSCNCYFVQMGEKTGVDNILNMAAKLGLGAAVLDGFPGEKCGNLEIAEGAVANLSIGQGELLATPLQVAHMTAVIANDGSDPGAHIVRTEYTQKECISAEIAAEIRSMMTETVEYGTASGLGLSVSAGAKTGSAQSTQGGMQVVHGWMSGYIPAENPQYVITVFIENGQSGRTSAGPVFAELAEYIYDKNLLDTELTF